MSDIVWTNDTRTLADLVPWEHNPKVMTKKQADGLRVSLDKFGLALPFLVGPDNAIYDGHQRDTLMQAMRQYGPRAVVDVRVSSRPLTDDERRELVVRLKQAQAGWDFEALPNLYDKDELLEWGFDLAELGLFPSDDLPDDPGAQIDRADELREKWQTAPGQLWQLGEHRLICGDCTDAAVVARVMGGEKAQFCVTSPPYPDAEMWETSAPELIKVGHDCLLVLRDVTDAGAAICWNTSDVPCGQRGVAPNPARDTMAALEMGWTKRAEIVWEKGLSYLPPPWNTRRPTVPNVTHETVLVFYNGERVPREKDGNLDLDALAWNRETVWKISPAKASKESHIAPFPVELADRCITLFSFKGDIVFDPFLGSGTTMIACERLGRRCRACEISPAYVAVTLQRWADMTKQTPMMVTDA